MSDPFIAEIRMFPFNFAPRGWAWCDGQILPIVQNTALFSLLGTIYGGNGTTNFALPNLQGRSALGAGQGPGLSTRDLGEQGGSATTTLLASQLPSHTHTVSAAPTATTVTPGNGVALASGAGAQVYRAATNPVPMAANSFVSAGGGQPHNNRQPYLGLYYAIALQGIFPPRQ